MTSDIAIRVEGLGKKYVIGHTAEHERYVALRDVIMRNARNLGRSALDLLRGRPMVAGDALEEFWALKDVGFEVRRGEVLGVIGRNGAGKSTLLKILSRITEPSEGRVTIHGRVASLLEVGTGFHPELTGRENIYLNGAILGMSHAEIRRKFDQIVDFAEVERFLDTPVKRFSSGMYVRLAFAVAAHLEPEILVVDEVLAVGDTEFQRKCLGKMSEVAGEGRTVIFVSHNLAAVETLCERAIVLKLGQLQLDAEVRVASRYYLDTILAANDVGGVLNDSPSDLAILRLGVLDAEGRPAPATVRSGDPVTIRLTLRNITGQTLRDVNIALAVKNINGQVITLLESRFIGRSFPMPPGEMTVDVSFAHCPLSAGVYGLGVRTDAGGAILCSANVVASLRVEGGDFYGVGAMPPEHITCVLIPFDMTASRAAAPMDA